MGKWGKYQNIRRNRTKHEHFIFKTAQKLKRPKYNSKQSQTFIVDTIGHLSCLDCIFEMPRTIDGVSIPVYNVSEA